MTLLGFTIEGGAQVNAGHYALGGTTTDLECLHITTQAMCINQDERKACKDDFQLEVP